MLLFAGISRVALYGVNNTVLAFLHNAHMVDCPVAVPIEKDNRSCRWLIVLVLPLPVAVKPISTVRTEGEFRYDAAFQIAALVGTPRCEAVREDVLYQLVLKQLQHFLSYLQQFERVFIRQQIDTTLAERRYELSAKQKQIEKDEKRMEELDRLFRKIYEDNVNGKLNDERFYKLSDGYEAEQEQLKQEIEALKAEVSEADTEATNVSKLIAVTKKYTRIDELTPEILNTFVDKIVVHECEKKDGKRTQDIDIYYSYVGIVDIPTDEEMREMEREYGKRTKRQTA